MKSSVVIKTPSIRAVILALRKEQKPLHQMLNGLRNAKRWKEKTYTPYGTKEVYVVTDALIDSLSQRVVNIHKYVYALSQISKTKS